MKKKNDYLEIFYPESRFGGFCDIDGTVAFYSRVNALLEPHFTVLDMGCGRGAYGDDKIPYRRGLRILKGKCKAVIGMDVDETAAANPFIDEFRRITPDSYDWPVESSSIDLCLIDNVLEHISQPDKFFSEISRILRPGGYFCIRTPNIFSYFGLASMLIPNRLHGKVVGRVQVDRKEEDVFQVFNRCNTIYRMRKTLRRFDFEFCAYTYEANPAYLAFSRLAYWLGTLHQKFAPKWLRLAIFAFGRKL